MGEMRNNNRYKCRNRGFSEDVLNGSENLLFLTYLRKLPRTTASLPYFRRISSRALSSFRSFWLVSGSKRFICTVSWPEQFGSADTQKTYRRSVPELVEKTAGIAVNRIGTLARCPEKGLMGNGVEIMKFNFDTDHSGKLAGPAAAGKRRTRKETEALSGQRPVR